MHDTHNINVAVGKCSCGFVGKIKELIHHWWMCVHEGNTTYTTYKK